MDPSAAGRLMVMQQMIARARESAQRQREAGPLREAALRQVGLDADAACTLLIVPAQRERMTEVTPERRRTLRRFIAALLRAAVAERNGAELPAPSPVAIPPAVAQHACAACRGHCCQHGGDRAYLTDATMLRVACSGDRPSPGRILRRYMERVPREAVRGSCIFHAVSGCALERPLRSDACNSYYCSALDGHLRDAPEHETRDVLVMAVRDEILCEARLVSAEKSR